MRKNIQLPRILKINWIEGLSVSVVFNNGESRVIDFQDLFSKICMNEDSSGYILTDPKEFAKMKLEAYTLSWENASQVITGPDGNLMEVPFEIGPDTLFEFSKPEKADQHQQLGRIIRENRIKSGMTQQELAMKSGTTHNYISRIENNRSDIEMATLRKIIEVGLGKKLEIVIRSP
jgi:DNA-binding XRE family transcriptional regulator